MDTPPTPEQAYEDEIRWRAKRELRKRMRSVRGALPASAIAARSEALTANVLRHDAWQAARTVALFMSMPDEVQTAALIAAARAAGKRVALPVVTDAPTLTFRAPYDGGSNTEPALVMSAFGILEPGEDAPVVAPADLDFVLVPALAIDPRGHRIGYGRGYYDHTFAATPTVLRAAVAFDFQLIAEVPERAGDLPAQWIITDRRVLRAEGGPGEAPA